MNTINCDIVQEPVSMTVEGAPSKTSLGSGKQRGKQTAKSHKQSLDTSMNSACPDNQPSEQGEDPLPQPLLQSMGGEEGGCSVTSKTKEEAGAEECSPNKRSSKKRKLEEMSGFSKSPTKAKVCGFDAQEGIDCPENQMLHSPTSKKLRMNTLEGEVMAPCNPDEIIELKGSPRASKKGESTTSQACPQPPTESCCEALNLNEMRDALSSMEQDQVAPSSQARLPPTEDQEACVPTEEAPAATEEQALPPVPCEEEPQPLQEVVPTTCDTLHQPCQGEEETKGEEAAAFPMMMMMCGAAETPGM